ncbi:MAG: tryptophan 7-halogenase [Woeseiaceae bacterium]|nr:tryptophan 7-halogenase [Woeseiaceae bacterium]
MPDRLRKIVVVGGDAAAASVAAGIAYSLRDTGILLTLVDDPAQYRGIASTLPSTVNYHHHLGIEDASLIRATGATCKLGYEYIGWGHPDNRFVVTTGASGVPIRLIAFHHYIARERLRGGGASLDDYSLAAVLAENGRFMPPSADGNEVTSSYRYGLHLDRQRYATALARIAEGFGADVRKSTVTKANRNAESGFVESVELADGDTVEGDLFIDCSGERAVLIGHALEVDFETWQNTLPCDRSVAVESTGTFDQQPVTRIIAKPHGWMRRVQLLDRSHFEYFYSSGNASEEDVLRNISNDVPGAGDIVQRRDIVRGHRSTPWCGNVVAIGRAAADFESLESSSLTRAHKAVLRLLNLLPDRDCNPAIAAEFNRLCVDELLQIRDLIALCYARNGRRNEGFWAYCSSLETPESTSKRLNLFETHGRFLYRDYDAAGEDYLVALLTGLGCLPRGYDPLADALPQSALDERLANLRNLVADAVARAPTHQEYLSNIHGPAG